MKKTCLALLAMANLLSAETLFNDDYSMKDLEGRSPERSEWVMKDGVISSKFDQALFEKFKSHGPIVWYSHKELTDCEVSFDYYITDETTSVVFTYNKKKGHAYRSKLRPDGINSMVWGQEKKATKVPKQKSFEYKKNTWVPVKLTFVGNKLTINIDGQIQEFEDEKVATPKAKFSYQYTGGELKVRNFKLTTP
ncbi:MAG: DUF1080 domain-containing protein [Lentisphaeraceae bacterium]|nr:DUF1080 domain-containing protein [Lentisphaeraceae bacterium]